MTRGQKIAGARRGRAAGKTLQELADRYGVTKNTIRNWLDPKVARAGRTRTKRWKAKNPDQLRRGQRAYDQRRRSPCQLCSKPAKGTYCKTCAGDLTRIRWTIIAGLWNDGKTSPQIALVLDTTPNSIRRSVYRMRKAGWDLQRRQKART